jgi:hypothetical protein
MAMHIDHFQPNCSFYSAPFTSILLDSLSSSSTLHFAVTQYYLSKIWLELRVFGSTSKFTHIHVPTGIRSQQWRCTAHGPWDRLKCSTLLLLLLLLLLCILSQAFSSWYFSWTSGDPHRSGFKLHTAVLSVLCVIFQVYYYYYYYYYSYCCYCQYNFRVKDNAPRPIQIHNSSWTFPPYCVKS